LERIAEIVEIAETIITITTRNYRSKLILFPSDIDLKKVENAKNGEEEESNRIKNHLA